MFFIIYGFGKRKGGEKALTDDYGRKYTIFYIGNYISLFYIPLFTFSKVYYITIGNNGKEITKEEYMHMNRTGKVMDKFMSMFYTDDNPQSTYNTAENNNYEYANEFCPVCKNKLESHSAYCPNCGQKQPRK